MVIKYKLGDLAKDLGLPNKEVISLLGEFGAGKKHTTVLTEEELDFAFNVVTLKYRAPNLEQYLVESAPAAAKPSGDAKVDEAFRKAAESKQARKKSAPAVQQPSKQQREQRVIDTRAAVVEIDKYNEKYENIAQTSAGRPARSNKRNAPQGKKQKFNQRSQQRGRPQSAKRETEAQRLQRLQLEKARKAQLRISVPDEISVGELASRLKVTAPAVVKKLVGLGIMAAVSDTVDFDTASLVAEEFGARVEREIHMTIEERLNITEDAADTPESLSERPPVVVVMGHVDHGKTSLLDYIRSSRVVEGEAGGITQHIGAYRVTVGKKQVTFLDTPGHEAFTSMRARGASITDIAILVVAADDGIMPQTVEAINHAKAAGVAIIVAINKMDKPEANAEKVKQELTEYELVPEEWGGDVVVVPVSAKTGEGVGTLLEMITLVSDVKELKANPDRLARGTVIEARLDKGRGPVATILIQNGTLRQGDVIIAGTAVGRVRAMTDDLGGRIEEAGPSVPVEITGLVEVPAAGDVFNAVEDEKLARELVDQRRESEKQEQFKAYKKVTLDNLFSQIAEGEVKELPIIVKADVQGSAEAIKQSLEQLSNEEVRVRIIHTGVGGVSGSDVMLADASGAIIIGFNVRPDPTAAEMAESSEVDMHMYRVIYDAIDDVKAALKGMLAPKIREAEQGRIEVREVYKVSSIGTVAGCYVQSGHVTRGSLIRVVRDGIVINTDKVASLRRFKDDVKGVAQGYECGITLERFGDIKQGDIFEAYILEEYRD
jgi:translation initiation factor IF-2